MKTLKFKGYSDDIFGEYGVTNTDYDNCAIDYPEDVKKIAAFLLDKDIIMSRAEIQKKYRSYCEDTDAAGWLEPEKFRLESFYRTLMQS